jgi:hypothetical protein
MFTDLVGYPPGSSASGILAFLPDHPRNIRMLLLPTWKATTD